jgi:hypothetical protein
MNFFKILFYLLHFHEFFNLNVYKIFCIHQNYELFENLIKMLETVSKLNFSIQQDIEHK